MPQFVVTPGEQPFVRVGLACVEFAQSTLVLLRAVRCRERPVGQIPDFSGNHVGHQGGSAENRVEVLLDEPWEHDRSLQPVVELERCVTQRRDDFVDGPHCDNPPVAHCHGTGIRQIPLHRQEPCPEHPNCCWLIDSHMAVSHQGYERATAQQILSLHE